MRIHLSSPALAGLLLLANAACGGGDKSPTKPPPPVATTLTVRSGGDQTARIGTELPTAPVVAVLDQNGAAMPNISVTFAVTAGGGAVAQTSATTDASGAVTLPTWKLGSTPGPNTVTVTANAGRNPTVQVSATARPPRWTVMVFMAADNNLAVEGLGDIEEMEAAGTSPEVQVVVQAEFSPQQLALYGCGASCFNRPNFNTFRYLVGTPGPNVIGPNGAATDIGNRNMTDPAQIREFITWAKATYPAERYALVLWNHGNGYSGLLEDITSAGPTLMPLAGLPQALAGVGTLDVINFDMCLMAGYETLAQLSTVAKAVVFSQETEPGTGDPYKEILQALYANPTADARIVAGMIVDQYHTWYTAKADRAPTTKSAYDLSGFASFEAALNAVAGTLRTNAGAMTAAISAAAARSQSYTERTLKDVGDFADSLRVRTTDATLVAQLNALKAQATSDAFRIRSRARNGTGYNGAAVSRSTGLNVLLPSGTTADRMASTGIGSFATYQTTMASKPWTQFLQTWLATAATVGYVDQGTNRFETYLVWDTLSVKRGADLDLWVLEPNGNLYIPYLGVVTPNGHLSNDSYETSTWFEGYLTNRYVQRGRYKFYAALFSDPNNARPLFDIQYRNSQTANFSSLFAPNYPRLSLQTSWLKDPQATFVKVDADTYTDLRYAAYVDIGTAAATTEVADVSQVRAPNSTGQIAARVAPGEEPWITRQQLETVRAAREKLQQLRVSGGRVTPRLPEGLRPVARP
jgi:hypothetical protein